MSDRPVGVGVVGYGYWGPRLVRNFQNAGTTRALAICERDENRRELAQHANPSLPVVADLDELLAIPDVEAVAIATPVATHHRLAKQVLLADRHLLVEKPITRSAEEGAELIRIARERNRVLMVDHTFLFTPAVQKLRELMEAEELGELLYYDSIRINLGLFQPDVDVIWDLAPHDLSILDFVIPHRPRRISAIGASHSPSGLSDVAYVTLDFGDNLLGHLHLNWLAPMKVRQILIGGSKKMAVFNDILADEKVRIYNRGIDIADSVGRKTITVDDREGRYQTLISYRTGDVYAPWLDRTEALFSECSLFGRVIRSGTPFFNDGLSGLRVVLMLEAATRSLNSGGGFIDVEWDHLEDL